MTWFKVVTCRSFVFGELRLLQNAPALPWGVLGLWPIPNIYDIFIGQRIMHACSCGRYPRPHPLVGRRGSTSRESLPLPSLASLEGLVRFRLLSKPSHYCVPEGRDSRDVHGSVTHPPTGNETDLGLAGHASSLVLPTESHGRKRCKHASHFCKLTIQQESYMVGP